MRATPHLIPPIAQSPLLSSAQAVRRAVGLSIAWNRCTIWLTAGCLAVSLASVLHAQPAAESRPQQEQAINVSPAELAIDYATQIKPILTAKCVACHGALQQQGGLRLDTAELARQGGDSGPAVEPGNQQSLLLARVTSADEGERMPQDGAALTAEQIHSFKAWIAQGAPSPADEVPEQDPRQHWAFRPLVRPQVPEFATGAVPTDVSNPIDAFLARAQAARGVTAQQPAPIPLLVRRLYLDLLGVPPTWSEFQQAAASLSTNEPVTPIPTRTSDGAPATDSVLTAENETQNKTQDEKENDVNRVAYEQLVERLLNDPRHGERWARHWMDIWRYSDAWGLGDQHRNSQKHIWHWRDWIVDSLNADLPYDEMVRQMLAADELYPEDLNRLRATGFLARNYFLFNRHQWMDETVEHVSKAFLGLTMNCAKCHDHKYDPIDQVDYYRLRAFFEPYHVRLDVVPGEPDVNRDAIPRVFDREPNAPTYLLVRGQETQPDKSRCIEPGVPEVLSFRPLTIAPITLPLTAWQPARRPWVITAHIDQARQRLTKLQTELAAAHATPPTAAPTVALATAPTAPHPPAPATEQPEPNSDDSALRAAELARKVLARRVAVAQAELDSVVARGEAMQARWDSQPAETGSPAASSAPASTSELTATVEPARVAAIRAERELAVAQIQLNLALTEEQAAQGTAEQREAAQKKLTTVQEELAAATAKRDSAPGPDDQFTPLSGTQWTATRFGNSLADDPTVDFGPLSSGRRSALAAWITDQQNPLTARVAVNHLWARHFGTPLVANLFDFGRKGAPPAHPELLDWLAVELMESGWSMKHIHRLIVTSAAYRRSSSIKDAAESISRDSENTTYWRRTAIRLESQVIRDTILAMAGELDTTRGGRSVPSGEQATSRRRSLYFWHSDIDRNLFLTTFDEAAVKECYRREQSIVPQQALALINSELVLNAAEPIARQLTTMPPKSDSNTPPASVNEDERAFVERAFALLLGSVPSQTELELSLSALAAWREQSPVGAAGESLSPRAYFIWALLNHNDFVTLR